MSNTALSDAKQRMKAVLSNELVTVRYQIANVERAIDFYTRNLGFTVEGQRSPVFATVALGNLRLLLSGPGSSGARPMPSGQKQEFKDVAADAVYEIQEERGLHKVQSLAPPSK